MNSDQQIAKNIKKWYVQDGYSNDQIIDKAIEFNASLNGDAIGDESVNEHIKYITGKSPNYWRQKDSDAKAINDSKKTSHNPGYITEDLLDMPGFVNDHKEHTLKTQMYPNPAMAYCGAISYHSMQVSRRLTDRWGTTPNIYVMGIGDSGSGKNRSREVNKELSLAAEMDMHMAEQFASAEGIEDAMYQHKVMLFQNDEFDTFLTNTNSGKDIRYVNLQGLFLRFYTEAKSFYTMRRLAKETERKVIHRPHLIIFGTAVGRFFYGAITEQQLDNGFYSRNWVIEGDFERIPNIGMVTTPVPDSLVEVAAWWKQYNNKFFDLNPELTVVEHNEDALKMVEEMQHEFDARYREAKKSGDGMGTSLWARALEGMNKYCLLSSSSRNYKNLYINTDDVERANKFMNHQLEQSLHMIETKVYEHTIQKDIAKAKRIIEKHNGTINKGVLQGRMGSMKSRMFNELLETMTDMNMIETEKVKAEGRGRPPIYIRYIGSEYGNPQ